MKDLSTITDNDLDHVADCFIESAPSYANFATFWKDFLREDPTINDVAELLLQLSGMGYSVNTNMGALLVSTEPA